MAEICGTLCSLGSTNCVFIQLFNVWKCHKTNQLFLNVTKFLQPARVESWHLGEIEAVIKSKEDTSGQHKQQKHKE